MWERFSYYGMRTLLVLYMTNYLLLPGRPEKVLGYQTLKRGLEAVYGHLDVQPLSSHIYGLYTMLVYVTPIFGGILADRFLGKRKTVVIGGLLIAAGHFLLAFEHLFLIALLFLVVGTGGFKPNVSSQVGGLYPAGDARRDRAFSIFYVGINLGAFLQLICGTLARQYGAQTEADVPNPNFNPADPGVGWHYGFGAAGVGMLLGLIVYLIGQRHLPPDHTTSVPKVKKGVAAEKPPRPR